MSKDYRKELDNFEYSKKSYPIPNEHAWDSLEDKEEVKKLESGKHDTQIHEVDENIFKSEAELLKPRKGDLKQSSPEITGQYNAL